MNEIENILQSIASDFLHLADELTKRDSQHRTRIDYLETEVAKNKETLRKVADVIIGELGD